MGEHRQVFVALALSQRSLRGGRGSRQSFCGKAPPSRVNKGDARASLPWRWTSQPAAGQPCEKSVHFMMYRLSGFGAARLCLVLKKVLEVWCMCYFKSMGGGKTTFTLFEKIENNTCPMWFWRDPRFRRQNLATSDLSPCGDSQTVATLHLL